MTFTDVEKLKIRKYAGYMAYGLNPYGNLGLLRWGVNYNTLEFMLINRTDDEITEVRTNFLPTLDQLFSDIPATRDNSDTAQAAVWYRNPLELPERIFNYNQMRMQLCDFLGIPYGPALRKTQLRICI